MSNHIRRLALFCLAATLGLVASASAQRFVPLHTFSTAAHFFAPLAQASDGTLYGVSSKGGLANDGTVFKLQPDGSGFAIIYSFTNGDDGAGPVAGLVVSGNTLYGTAMGGGSGGNGTVFKLNTDGSGFDPIYSFSPFAPSTNTDGASPAAALVLADGVLYGTASRGGRGYGTVFKVNTDGSGFSNLWNFSGVVGSVDGTYPLGALLLSGDTLYGTTQEGGANSGGTVFKIDTEGMNFTTLHAFTATPDGELPKANLVLSGDTLYGTASGGGAYYGTVFRVNIDGNGFTNLYNFTNGVDGSAPVGGLVITNNTLYGTASSGGIFPGWGTVFRLGADGAGFTNLYDFKGNGDAVQPNAGLVLSGDALIGTTLNSGSGGGGSVFSINTDGTGFKMLAYGNDGTAPEGGLVLSGGTAYGTTSSGGALGAGTVFEINTNGTGFANLHAFSATSYNSDVNVNAITNTDGSAPMGTLVLSDGALYGAASAGGDFGFGTVYRLNTNGTAFTNLYNFTNSLTGNPSAGLVLAGNALFGTTFDTIFTINTDGSGFSNIYTFSSLNGGTNSDGNGPLSSLTLSGGTLYGAAYYGGPLGGGTLFRIETNGSSFSNIYSFTSANRSSGTNAQEGANPQGGLIVAGDTLYGAATGGGLGGTGKAGFGLGTIFEANADGTDLAPVFIFPKSDFDGGSPNTRLLLSSNIFYGTTSGGNGTVFQVNADGTGFMTLHTFAAEGGTPAGDLVLAGDTLYGTSEFSVPGSGFVFAVNPTVTPAIQFTATPTTGSPPLSVTFNAPSVDSGGNSILYYRLDFGDGTTGATSLPATHIYTTNGVFTPTLVVTNVNGAVFAGAGPSIVVAFPTSIQNNGFEAGTFTNWTLSGNSGQTIATTTNYVHSGAYGAQLRASGFGYLSQIITTMPGDAYTVSFWLNSFSARANEFQVSWDGSIIFDQTNIGAIGWTNIQLTVPATAVNTVLQFGYKNASTPYFGLDDVSVTSGAGTTSQPAIASAYGSGGNLVLNCGGGSPAQTYYVFMGTNLLEPISQWIPVATNGPGASGNFSITATNAVDPKAPQRFFIIEAQ